MLMETKVLSFHDKIRAHEEAIEHALWRLSIHVMRRLQFTEIPIFLDGPFIAEQGAYYGSMLTIEQRRLGDGSVYLVFDSGYEALLTYEACRTLWDMAQRVFRTCNFSSSSDEEHPENRLRFSVLIHGTLI